MGLQLHPLTPADGPCGAAPVAGVVLGSLLWSIGEAAGVERAAPAAGIGVERVSVPTGARLGAVVRAWVAGAVGLRLLARTDVKTRFERG